MPALREIRLDVLAVACLMLSAGGALAQLASPQAPHVAAPRPRVAASPPASTTWPWPWRAGESPGPVPAAPAAPKPPADPMAAAGRAYAPQVLAAFADGWTAAAEVMERGGSVAECQKALWQARAVSLQISFKATAIPAMRAVLPEGAEPKDAAERARVAAAWRAFAAGLRGGK